MKRLATIAAATMLAASFAPPAHADDPIYINWQGGEASPCKPVQDELEDAQARVDVLDRKVTVMSVRLRQVRATVKRQQSTIERLRDQLAAARR